MEKIGGKFLQELRGEVRNFSYTALRLALMIVVTICQILRLKCTKFDFGWGSAPDPAGGAYSAPLDPLAGFKGPTFKGRQTGEDIGKEGKGGEREGRGRGTCSKVLVPCIPVTYRYMLSQIRLSVVYNVLAPYSGVEDYGNISSLLCTLAIL